MTTPPRKKEYRILSLAGGGYLGLYTACLLTELESRIGEPLARRFDLIAGTSVGGLLALGLAFELPMRSLTTLFVQKGSEIFSPRPLPSNAVGRLLDLSRSVLGPKYSGVPLREQLEQLLGEKTLGEALHHVVIPAVNVSQSLTKVFKTPHAPSALGDENLKAVDVAMATSAAPGYFPCVKIDKTLFADGGIFAVAPDQVALHEAEHFMNIDITDIRMLSIGTATAGYQPADGVNDDTGAVGWLSEGRLILTLIAVQQQHVQAMMEDRLQDRYLHLDAAWPIQAGLGIDVATSNAAETLIELAKNTIEVTPDKLLARFL